MSADCVRPLLSVGHNSSPKNEEAYTIVSPFAMPLLAALPLTFCDAQDSRMVRRKFMLGWTLCRSFAMPLLVALLLTFRSEH